VSSDNAVVQSGILADQGKNRNNVLDHIGSSPFLHLRAWARPPGIYIYSRFQAPNFSAISTQRGAMDLLTTFVQGVMGSSPFSVLQPGI
jgi:hypothetical protein